MGRSGVLFTVVCVAAMGALVYWLAPDKRQSQLKSLSETFQVSADVDIELDRITREASTLRKMLEDPPTALETRLAVLEQDVTEAKAAVRRKNMLLDAANLEIEGLKAQLAAERAEAASMRLEVLSCKEGSVGGCNTDELALEVIALRKVGVASSKALDEALESWESLKSENRRLSVLVEQECSSSAGYGEHCERELRNHVDMITRLRRRTLEFKEALLDNKKPSAPSWIGMAGFVIGSCIALLRAHLSQQAERRAEKALRRKVDRGSRHSMAGDTSSRGSLRSFKRNLSLPERRMVGDFSPRGDPVDRDIVAALESRKFEKPAARTSDDVNAALQQYGESQETASTIGGVNWLEGRDPIVLSTGDRLVLPDLSELAVGLIFGGTTVVDLSAVAYARGKLKSRVFFDSPLGGGIQLSSDQQAVSISFKGVAADVDAVYICTNVFSEGAVLDSMDDARIVVVYPPSSQVVSRYKISNFGTHTNAGVPLRFVRKGQRWDLEALGMSFAVPGARTTLGLVWHLNFLDEARAL